MLEDAEAKVLLANQAKAVVAMNAAAQSAKGTPLDPTKEMIEAGAQRLVRWETGKEVWPDAWSKLDVRAARNDAERCWRSMWLASPPTEEVPRYCQHPECSGNDSTASHKSPLLGNLCNAHALMCMAAKLPVTRLDGPSSL